MTALTFAPAVRHEAKARVAIVGPTGAGKTWTALEWASTLGEKIAVIDTENGSAALYSDAFTFDTARWLPPYDASKLAAAVNDAAGTYDVVVLDSLTHFWQGEGGVLDKVEKAAEKARGNTYAGWKVGTPIWRGLLDALIYAPCHVIVTMRSKMDYVQSQVDGKTKIEKVGMAPVARNDVEYEFTVVGEMDQAHRMTITKSRFAAIADVVAAPHQAAKLAVKLRDWLGSADATAAPERPVRDGQEDEAQRVFDELRALPAGAREEFRAWKGDRSASVESLADPDWRAKVEAWLHEPAPGEIIDAESTETLPLDGEA